MDTFLGAVLKLYLRADRRRLQEVAGAIGRHPSQLSRIVSGERCHLEREELESLVQAIAPEDRDRQANLIVAYLLDQCPESFRDEVRIENVRGSCPSEPAPQPEPVGAAAPE
jgi:hypothetical protein